MKSLLFLLKQKLQNNFYFLPLIKFSVREESMQPLLYPGDTILVQRLLKGHIGDSIVFKNPKKNEEPTYLIKQIVKEKRSMIYVLGLNKNKSRDSRHFGWIEKKDIIGKMIMKI